MRKIFPLTSRLVFAPAVLERIPERELMDAFARHDTGDWGLVSTEVGKQNSNNLKHGGELVSEYESKEGRRFKVITTSRNHITRFVPA